MIGKPAILADQTTMNRAAGNRLLAAMPSDALSLLDPHLKTASLAQGLVCFGPGDPIDQVYFPYTGMISLLVTTGDGEIVETSSVGREGAVGFQSALGLRLSFTRAVVQIPGRFWTVAASRFESAADRSPGLRTLVYRYIEVLWAEAQQVAACNAIHDGSSRLCRWLLQCADRTGSDTLPLTQEFLAEMLGVRRTTVTLLAQELQKRGVVKYSRGKIAILDRGALEGYACECYDVLRHENLPLKIGLKF